jgi:uncharacterized radical SAM superfamily Fe-S cluster-containing enzyme
MPDDAPVDPGGKGPERRFALGIGLTNECNLACAFCYRDPSRVDRLDLEQVRAVLDQLPVQSVNLGTGENGMHSQFHEMLALLRSRNVKLTMTSNGLSVAILGTTSCADSTTSSSRSTTPTVRNKTRSAVQATGIWCTNRRGAAAGSGCR